MPEKIEPALSSEEWSGEPEHALNVSAKMAVFSRVVLFEGALEISTPNQILEGWDGRTLSLRDPSDFAALIALANAALPDDDPRKITREWVRYLREEAGKYENVVGVDESGDDIPDPILTQIADALESYLPPSP